MSVYEYLRVLLAIAQLFATLGAPFVIVWFDRKMRPNRDSEESSRGKRPWH